jgi:hypothetical protein
MNDNTRTSSILQRVPVILAVTAASYGLPVQSHSQRTERSVTAHHAVAETPAVNALERMREAIDSQD